MITEQQKKEFYNLLIKQSKSKSEGGDYESVDKAVEDKKKEIKLNEYPEVGKELAEKLFKESNFFAGLTAVTMMVFLDKNRAKALVEELEKKTSERTASLLIKGLRKYHNI